MRLAGQAKGGFYPTPDRVTGYIATMVGPGRTASHKANPAIRILDPCCGPGDAVSQVAAILGTQTSTPIETYGVELHNERAMEASSKLTAALGADIFTTSISNGAFQILFMNPPYDQDAGPDSGRTEHSFLTHCTRYLAPHGLLIYIVPQHRVHHSARYLATMYGNIKMLAFPEPEYQVFKQVVITATKMREPYTNRSMENYIHREADNNKLVKLGPEREPAYFVMPETTWEMIFYNRMPDPIAAATEARTNGLWTNPKATELLWPHQTLMKKPLMPLRKGHMAMLIAAGFLNNMALEHNGETILVKGTTTKEEYIAEETEDSTTYRQRVRATIATLNMNTGELTEIKA